MGDKQEGERWRGNGKTWSIAVPDKGKRRGYGGGGRRDEPMEGRILGSWLFSRLGRQRCRTPPGRPSVASLSGRSKEALPRPTALLCQHKRSNRIYIYYSLVRRHPPRVPPSLPRLPVSTRPASHPVSSAAPPLAAAIIYAEWTLCVPFFTSARDSRASRRGPKRSHRSGPVSRPHDLCHAPASFCNV
ncbi:hypothetical protein GY45DRAFT_371253 [Cubamyces sp. BRFM 1775]|nr:hypothetical protein GY45DRAFT_371253 [Cubamyces sp. BRFM 1775]